MPRQTSLVVLIGIIGLTASPLEAKSDLPLSTDVSSKSVDELAGCVSLKLAESRGYEIVKSDIPKGIRLALRFRIAGIPSTAARIEIIDVGAQRQMMIFAKGKTNGAPKTIARQARDCLG